MKPYPKYKDSGIEWIGEIPEHWNYHRIKPLITSSTNGIWGDDPKDDDNDLVCIRVADFDYDHLKISNQNITLRNIPFNQQSDRLLKRNDLLIEKSGGGEQQPVGRLVIYDNDFDKAVCSNFIGKMTVNEDMILARYLLYYTSSLYSKRLNTKSIKQTTGIQNLDLYSYFSEII